MKRGVIMGSSWIIKGNICKTTSYMTKSNTDVDIVGFRLIRVDWSKYIRGYQRRIKGGCWMDSTGVLWVGNKRSPRHNHNKGIYGFRLMKLKGNKND